MILHCSSGQSANRAKPKPQLLLRSRAPRLRFPSPLAVPGLLCSVLLIFLNMPGTLARAQSDLKGLLEQARAYEKTGNYAGAEQIYQQALAIAPENPETLKRLGVLQQTELKFADSIEVFRRVLLATLVSGNQFFLGATRRKSFSQAIHSFEQELATANPHPRCRYYLGLALQFLTAPMKPYQSEPDGLKILKTLTGSTSLRAFTRTLPFDRDLRR